MNRRDLKRELVRLGFKTVRFGKHETMVKDGHQIQLPTSGKQLNFRLEKQIKIYIRNIMKDTEEAA